MNCRETRRLLPLFFDGEIEARQMRAVALSVARCPECEEELRQYERLQDVLVEHVAAWVDEVDLGQVWAGVAPRIESMPHLWYHRWRAWWATVDGRWRVRGPAYAAVAVACVLALMLWQRETARHPPELAAVDNSAVLDSVHSNVESVAFLREPETNTMVLWITDDTLASGDSFGDLP